MFEFEVDRYTVVGADGRELCKYSVSPPPSWKKYTSSLCTPVEKAIGLDTVRVP